MPTTTEVNVDGRRIIRALSLSPLTFCKELFLLAKQLTDVFWHVVMRSQCITVFGEVNKLL
jgi:hypothetical protein